METKEQEFIKWLEEQEKKYEDAYYASPKWDRDEYASGCSDTYMEVKKKYTELFLQSIQQP